MTHYIKFGCAHHGRQGIVIAIDNEIGSTVQVILELVKYCPLQGQELKLSTVQVILLCLA